MGNNLKRLVFVVTLGFITGIGVYAQSQRMNRTNSRSHYPADTTRSASSRMDPQTDADRNNPAPGNNRDSSRNDQSGKNRNGDKR